MQRNKLTNPSSNFKHGWLANILSTISYFQSQINGIYDPCIGEEKSLKVIYEFRGVLHEVVVKDNEILRIPLQCKYTLKPSLGTKVHYNINV